MKKLYPLFLIALMFSCGDAQYPPAHKLSGDWLRVNNAPAQTTIEHWEKDEEKFIGFGKTYSMDSLVFHEKMQLLQDKNNRYLFVVEGVNEEATVFEISSWDHHSFTARNEDNPFPKFISYRFNKDSMIASIGDDKDTVLFNFIRSKEKLDL